jgi:hypothetical protein
MTVEAARNAPTQAPAAAVPNELPQPASIAEVPPLSPAPAPTTPDPDEARARDRAQTLNDHRKWLLATGYDTSSSFDKMLTTLSAFP